MTFMLAFAMFMAAVPAEAHANGGSYDGGYYYDTPVYTYNQPSYYPPQQNIPLDVSCYSNPTTARVGDTVTWLTSVHGGNGSYYYSWTGTDGLSGVGSSVSMVYTNPGYKNATLTVVSGNQTVARNCNSTTNVTGTYNNPPTYYPPTTYYQALAVSCSASNVGTYGNQNSVTWGAYATGGSGAYSYSWTGTDGLYGSGQTLYFSYVNPGTKYGTVTVYSNGQSVTQNCAAGVTVGNIYPVSYQPVTYYNNDASNQGLNIGCYSDPATIHADQPVTWAAEVTGGIAPYTYVWTGSDNLTGTGATVVKTYSTLGEKNAIVTITSADGKTGTRSCTNTLAVRGTNINNTVAVNTTPVVTPNNGNSLSAASLFSLGNVPWGWIAILIILLLFATVLYLIFNKPKI